ncbi:VCBS domain-containing protein [Hankyongella ginsenosidimutans]|uniref:VCBS domain-containing protein n=1 Tax=Hankyongella ginsenosidimutans TaxID=1763828 RepID=UPI001FEC16F1|nr:Ig-like domain-containing protein [Hankyongella ginsenosidimutans]
MQVPAGVTAQVTAIAVANGATGVVGQPLTSALGALTVAADGSYTFTPASNATVTALGAGVTATQNFTYTIQAGGTTYQPATLTITITGVNDAPVAAAPAPVTASASAPIGLGIVVPTDPDINANGQPDPLTVSSIVLRQNGSVNANLASAFRILPDGQAPQQVGQATPALCLILITCRPSPSSATSCSILRTCPPAPIPSNTPCATAAAAACARR